MVKPLKVPSGRGILLHADAIEYSAGQQKKLRRNLPRWNQFRSSLDAIRQTHRAIEAYNHSNGDLTDDQRYLAIYGLLQALVVQQDAMCHLSEALQTKPVHMNRHKRLEEIRNIRNWTVGHPTKIDRYDTHSHHAIQRPQLGRGGFSLYSAFDDGREQYTYVPLPQLARLQRRVVSRVLRDMLRELNSRDRKTTAQLPKSNPPVRSQPRSPRQQLPTRGQQAPLRGQHLPSRGQQSPTRRQQLSLAQPVGNHANPNSRGTTAHRGPAPQRWGRTQNTPESRRDGTPAGRPKPRHGTLSQKPPRFSSTVRTRKKTRNPPPALLPLPGEKFARSRSAA